MAISVDNTGFDATVGSATQSFGFTVGSGSDRIVFLSVIVIISGAGTYVSAATVGGNAAILISSQSYIDGGSAILNNFYYSLAPAIGSVTIAVTTAAVPTVIVTSVASYFGVKQTSPINVANNLNTGSSSSYTIGLTPSVPNCWAAASIENHFSNISVSSGCVFRSTPPGGAGVFDSNGTITASALHNFVVTATPTPSFWSGVMVAFEPAVVAAGNNYYGYVGYYQ